MSENKKPAKDISSTLKFASNLFLISLDLLINILKTTIIQMLKAFYLRDTRKAERRLDSNDDVFECD